MWVTEKLKNSPPICLACMASMLGIRYLAYQIAVRDGTYRIAANDAMTSFRRVS
jgi:hypothetical protein